MLKKAAVFIIFSLLTLRFYRISTKLGFFRAAFNYHPSNCSHISDIKHGSEDIQLIPNNRAFISSGLDLDGDPKKGAIYLVDFERLHRGEYKATKMKVKSKDSKTDLLIDPHGLSVWVHPNTGVIFLYIVDHNEGERVDKYMYDEKENQLTHQKSFQSEHFWMLNDIHVVNEDKFYFTNMLYTGSFLEFFLNFSWGSFGFYEDDKATILVQGLDFPNGIIANNRYLFVALMGEEAVNIYDLQNDLSLAHSIKVNAAVDNLTFDPETDDLILGCHVAFYKIPSHAADATKHSPSMVLRQELNYGRDGELEVGKLGVLYGDDGAQISASSVGQLVRGGGLLVGSVHTKLLYCSSV